MRMASAFASALLLASIGGIGVGGAPGGNLDEACAAAGIDAIKERL